MQDLKNPLFPAHHAQQADAGYSKLPANVGNEMGPAWSVLLRSGRFLRDHNSALLLGKCNHVGVSFLVLCLRVPKAGELVLHSQRVCQQVGRGREHAAVCLNPLDQPGCSNGLRLVSME